MQLETPGLPDDDRGSAGAPEPASVPHRPVTSGRGRRRKGLRNRKRPIEMLPTVVTLGNLFSGFLAIAYLTDSQHVLDPVGRAWLQEKAAFLIFLAMVFDALDGKIARMMHQTSKFGEQVDSICDAVSFGAAPALLFKVVCQTEPAIIGPRPALVLAVMFVAGAVVRLARFNVETTPDPESHKWFKGLPTPAAASVVASLVWLNRELEPTGDSWVRHTLPFIVPALSFLMVSRLRYIHAASWLFSRKSYPMLVLLVFVAAVTVLWNEYVIPLLCVGFMFSGPAWWLWSRFVRRSHREPIV